jgi:poly(3-hydroxyalkanoate) synthetase
MLVRLDGGLMSGRLMLQGWKNLDPTKQYLQKYLELYENIDDAAYIRRSETFSRWYEDPLDLPGRWYLQAITQLFKENRLAKGTFVALGEQIALGNITCPAFLLAGLSDEITPSAQVFAAENLLGTPKTEIRKELAPGGHIGLFMSKKTLRDYWPQIAAWLQIANPL